MASELRGSDEMYGDGAVRMSNSHVWCTKSQKNQLQLATLETCNPFNGLFAEEATDANDEDYEDELPPLKSLNDREGDTKMDDTTNEDVWSLSFTWHFLELRLLACQYSCQYHSKIFYSPYHPYHQYTNRTVFLSVSYPEHVWLKYYWT